MSRVGAIFARFLPKRGQICNIPPHSLNNSDAISNMSSAKRGNGKPQRSAKRSFNNNSSPHLVYLIWIITGQYIQNGLYL